MNFNSKTFCAAPWFHIRKEQDNKYRPCCDFDPAASEFDGKVNYNWPLDSPEDYLNSDYLKYIRQNLNQGIPLTECKKCWFKESMSSVSLRQIINDTVTNNQGKNLNNSWLNSYFQQKHNFDFDLLVSTDIKVSNLCNFSCVMCNPEDSSQLYTVWKKNKSHPIVQIKLNDNPTYLDDIKQRYVESTYDYLDMILNTCPRHVKLLGGEPLLDKTLLNRLQTLSPEKKSKISLLFVTNGSVNLTNFANQLKGYKQINYVVSIDGVGSVQDYIRRGSNWDQIQSNIFEWNQRHRPVDIAFTFQCLNAWYLPEFYQWCTDHHLKFTFGVVKDPDYLSVKIIPPEFRKKIFQKYDQSNIPAEQIEGFKKIIISNTYDQNLHMTTKKFLKWYDPDDRWKNILPEWQEFI
jgi:sulfatase maturation enzyme AslB (radical SAM superfamily)